MEDLVQADANADASSEKFIDATVKLPKPYEITTETARVYKVRGGRSCWVEATIRDWKGGGYLSVQSDFGNFAYCWGATGTDTLPEFLIRIEYDYFMNKAHPSRGRAFDHEATIAKIKADIISERKDGSLFSSEARDRMDDLDGLNHANNADQFYMEFLQTDWAYSYCDYSDICEYRDDYQCRAFWDGPWQALIAHWKRELTKQSPSNDDRKPEEPCSAGSLNQTKARGESSP